MDARSADNDSSSRSSAGERSSLTPTEVSTSSSLKKIDTTIKLTSKAADDVVGAVVVPRSIIAEKNHDRLFNASSARMTTAGKNFEDALKAPVVCERRKTRKALRVFGRMNRRLRSMKILSSGKSPSVAFDLGRAEHEGDNESDATSSLPSANSDACFVEQKRHVEEKADVVRRDAADIRTDCGETPVGGYDSVAENSGSGGRRVATEDEDDPYAGGPSQEDIFGRITTIGGSKATATEYPALRDGANAKVPKSKDNDDSSEWAPLAERFYDKVTVMENVPKFSHEIPTTRRYSDNSGSSIRRHDWSRADRNSRERSLSRHFGPRRNASSSGESERSFYDNTNHRQEDRRRTTTYRNGERSPRPPQHRRRQQIVEVGDDRGREFALDRHAHSHNTSRFDSRLERREEKRAGRGENYAIASHRTTLPQRNRIIHGNDDFDHDSHFRARHYHRGPYSQKRYDRSPERHYERDRSMRNSTSEDTFCSEQGTIPRRSVVARNDGSDANECLNWRHSSAHRHIPPSHRRDPSPPRNQRVRPPQQLERHMPRSPTILARKTVARSPNLASSRHPPSSSSGINARRDFDHHVARSTSKEFKSGRDGAHCAGDSDLNYNTTCAKARVIDWQEDRKRGTVPEGAKLFDPTTNAFVAAPTRSSRSTSASSFEKDRRCTGKGSSDKVRRHDASKKCGSAKRSTSANRRLQERGKRSAAKSDDPSRSRAVPPPAPSILANDTSQRKTKAGADRPPLASGGSRKKTHRGKRGGRRRGGKGSTKKNGESGPRNSSDCGGSMKENRHKKPTKKKKRRSKSDKKKKNPKSPDV